MRGLASVGSAAWGHIVPSQFLEASVQEEGSALHKLVGDLVDSHRFLSLFIIVSPILWGKNGPVGLMRWFRTVGTMALWDFKGPLQALTETFMNMCDLEQSYSAFWASSLNFSEPQFCPLLKKRDKNRLNVERSKWGNRYKYLASCQAHIRAR